MIIACIDLQGGQAVQLVRGRRRALAVNDVLGLLDRFREYPLLHVIDLDAALRCGGNARLVRLLCCQSKSRVHVGGGIRTVARAERILRWGAEKVIVGSAAFRGGKIHQAFLRRLARRVGRRRIILALDAEEGRIVVRGWRQQLSLRPEDVMPQLEPYCSEFLCTCVENEGTMRGTNLAWFRALRRATRLPVTAAGGIRSRREVRALARLGMNAAVGMALYRDQLR
ncbi:MAG: 1-(5-phosphoribosyl)-5-[(5-phosphoribosylamino)methylideneamino] imidazole-4-carboxamide isomerase [Acidobacteria bacterium]|nr:1-(5-phosphoribosyl)-5-[(5-phosphoribosylamino)methylideneamino] imidazole-4-carboxamide isomerase [Acidobacteriota bacterium]